MGMRRRSSPGRDADQAEDAVVSKAPVRSGTGVGVNALPGGSSGTDLRVCTILPKVPIKTSNRKEWSIWEIGLYMERILTGEY